MELEVFALVLNGLCNVFSLTSVLLLVWYNWKNGTIQIFALLTIFVSIWNLSALLYELENAALFLGGTTLIRVFSQLGFVGSVFALYALTLSLVRLFSFPLKLLSFFSFLVLASFQAILIFAASSSEVSRLPANELYLVIGAIILFVVIRYRHRIDSTALQALIITFVLGQSAAFFNPRVGASTFSLLLCSFSAGGIGLALLWRELVGPLRDRQTQILNVRELAQSLSENIELNNLLSEIMIQATKWLKADAAAVFLKFGHDSYRMVSSLDLPIIDKEFEVRIGEGIVGKTMQTNKTLILEASDTSFKQMVSTSFPNGHEVFGSIMTSPLTNQHQVIGAVSVISNNQGKLFSQEDRMLLEILASETSIGVAYSQITNEIESSRHNLENVLDAIDSPIVTVNERGEIQYANRVARDLASKNHSLVPTDWKAASVRLKWYEQHIDDVYYNCQSIHLEGRFPPEWLIVYVDITREKQMSALRDDVIRLTSHDIKNPLQAAMANLELLQEDLANTNNPDIITSLSDLNNQLNRIERISNTILSSGREQIHTQCSVTNLLTESIQEAKTHLREPKHILHLLVRDKNVYVTGSAEQLKRAFVNLIDNAIKYSPSGTTVRVVSYLENGENIVEVHDEGIGIPLSIQHYVFRPFFRGHEYGQDTHSAVGSGVGLNIVKSVIENHRGRIWFESVETRGSTFFIALPVATNADHLENIETEI
ncbi:MAG TPA: GAF domain-containing sensor histidine kinase [Aggregatilineales bacterium]|nr:GAF domain-containing sensor histidine kinase [Aggregatilineales bacterium]